MERPKCYLWRKKRKLHELEPRWLLQFIFLLNETSLCSSYELLLQLLVTNYPTIFFPLRFFCKEKKPTARADDDMSLPLFLLLQKKLLNVSKTHTRCVFFPSSSFNLSPMWSLMKYSWLLPNNLSNSCCHRQLKCCKQIISILLLSSRHFEWNLKHFKSYILSIVLLKIQKIIPKAATTLLLPANRTC